LEATPNYPSNITITITNEASTRHQNQMKPEKTYSCSLLLQAIITLPQGSSIGNIPSDKTNQEKARLSMPIT
jgi:hypothetical protein